jgi:DNA mismatch endonuclease (patch repair protein)
MKRAPEVTHKIMAAVKSKNTRPEVALRKALWRQGLRFRVHYKGLPGKPDIVFMKARIAVFCDGDYWHGHNWALRGMKNFEEELAGYSEFWANKIRRNVQRDEEVNRQLIALGWQVLRIWESEINKDIISSSLKVKRFIDNVKIR